MSKLPGRPQDLKKLIEKCTSCGPSGPNGPSEGNVFVIVSTMVEATKKGDKLKEDKNSIW